MTALDAPYNFVPLGQQVCPAPDADKITVDLPFREGLSGCLELQIEAFTPLCIGDRHRKAKKDKAGCVLFYRLPDDTAIDGSKRQGTPAIPGATLRGMIRNVMEIACFAKMALVDDRRFSLRDLTGAAKNDYQQRIVGKSKAGWLYFDREAPEKGWRIKPCRFGRVTHEEIVNAGKLAARDFSRPHGGSAGTADGDRVPLGSAPLKYALWERGRVKSLEVAVIAGQAHDKQYAPDILDYRIATDTRQGQTRGTLVFTGQPNTKKKREFVFFETDEAPRRIESGVWSAFIDIHEDQHASVEWRYWRDKHFADPKKFRIPIFYIEDNGRIDALGLAMMFKLAGKHSTHGLRGDSHGGDALDLVEAIFGKVGKVPEDALRGRVAFGTATLVNPDDVRLAIQKPTVLGSPKPSYFPTYLRQPRDPHQATRLPGGEKYRTYMDDRAELAGWKRYPVHPLEQVGLPELNAANQDARQVQIELQTLSGKNGQRPRFKSRLHFHNLRPFELGAVLWALRFGERDTHRHAIGMAKPHGFGQVEITLGPKALATALTCNDGSTLNVGECLKRFCAHMKDWADKAGIPGSWEGSLQVQRLLAMAEPRSALNWPGRLCHMTLDPGNRVNEFVEAKRQKLVLAPYGDIALESQRPPIAGKSAAASSPRPAPAESARAAVAAPAPRAFGVLRHAAGTRVECAGDRGRLAEDWIDGVSKVLVTFDDGDDEVAVEAIVVLKG